ncbi:DUF5994 family protein [Streptacidiphilus sp. EB129]|uniref:DUF5994 family protein n=1 Tax=Streptacidiphilus sp. EB129 TaxID=3156262 RepID=UPI00351334A6
MATLLPPAVWLPPPRGDDSALRLALRPADSPAGLLDGAWWPRSDDLRSELPSLVAELDLLWGRITRVTVNPCHWQPLPGRVPAAGHVVKVGWFTTEQDPRSLLLLSYTVGRWDLLVIPPRTDPAAAARLMAAATDPAVTLGASALMATEAAAFGTAEARQSDSGAVAEWESEGGAAMSLAVPVPLVVLLTMPLGRMYASSGR